MTICIGALCMDNSMVVCASDRMITAGDVGFEPQKSKIIPLTTSIVTIIAGDTYLQEEILINVRAEVIARIKSDPKNWWNVSDVADLYLKYYLEAKKKRAEIAFLKPLGLDSDSFIDRQQHMDSQVVSNLTNRIISYIMPNDVETIFAGIDKIGAHIYLFQNGGVFCVDRFCFTTIGFGGRHAATEFMFAGHSGNKGLPETLLLTYFSKKRAEDAPFVGKATDMCVLGPALGLHALINEDHEILKEIDKIFRRTKSAQNRSYKKANELILSFLKRLAKTAQQQEVNVPLGDG